MIVVSDRYVFDGQIADFINKAMCNPGSCASQNDILNLLNHCNINFNFKINYSDYVFRLYLTSIYPNLIQTIKNFLPSHVCFEIHDINQFKASEEANAMITNQPEDSKNEKDNRL